VAVYLSSETVWKKGGQLREVEDKAISEGVRLQRELSFKNIRQ